MHSVADDEHDESEEAADSDGTNVHQEPGAEHGTEREDSEKVA